MTHSTRQSMLARLRESMAFDSLPPQDRAQCEQRVALTERLDKILFTEWDPIGVHLLEEFNCEDEYHSYLPEIVGMVTDGASLDEIADALYEFEESILDENLKCRRRCHIAAAKILGREPANDDNSVTEQRNRCASCQGHISQLPNAHCVDSACYGVKPPIQYIDQATGGHHAASSTRIHLLLPDLLRAVVDVVPLCTRHAGIQRTGLDQAAQFFLVFCGHAGICAALPGRNPKVAQTTFTQV